MCITKMLSLCVGIIHTTQLKTLLTTFMNLKKYIENVSYLSKEKVS